MDAYRLLQDLAVILGTAIAMGFVFYRLRQPVIIGYLVGGLLVGPYGLKFVSDLHTIETFAEIGVVLLMFALGVEFSLKELIPVRKVAGLGGAIQILGTIVLTALAASFFQLPLGTSILLGCIIALSSTVIVLKVLMERGELDSMHGRIALGMLIVQDLSMVPIMVTLPNLGDPAKIFGLPMLLALGKAAVFLLVVGWLGTRLFPMVMRRVALTRNRELFLLSATALCFGTAAATHMVGISLALGAFLAGIVVSESDHSHQILAEVRPLRDLFATLFFVSVGMLINPLFLLTHLPTVALLVVAIVLGKALFIFGIAKAFGYSGRTSLAVGMGLAQIGEFSFVLAKMGEANGLLSEEFFSLILGSALLSILLTPAMLGAATPLYRQIMRLPFMQRWANKKSKAPLSTGELGGLVDHVVICGFGRVGSNLGEVLLHHKIPVLIIDIDQMVIQRLRDQGVPCLYGDSSNLEVLKHALLPLAKTLVVAMPDPISCSLAVENAKHLNPKLNILARAHRTDDVQSLYDKGADEVIQPEFEASIEAIRYTLTKLGYTPRETYRYTSEIRQARYRQFFDDFHPEDASTLMEALGEQDFQWLEVEAHAEIVGQSLSEAAVRTKTGVAILAIRRNGITHPNPSPDAILEAGDMVLVMGYVDQLQELTRLLQASTAPITLESKQ